jgi:hypothetical protein
MRTIVKPAVDGHKKIGATPIIGLIMGDVFGLLLVAGMQMPIPAGWGVDWNIVYVMGASIFGFIGMAIEVGVRSKIRAPIKEE